MKLTTIIHASLIYVIHFVIDAFTIKFVHLFADLLIDTVVGGQIHSQRGDRIIRKLKKRIYEISVFISFLNSFIYFFILRFYFYSLYLYINSIAMSAFL